jgi:hypothetical protein
VIVQQEVQIMSFIGIVTEIFNYLK